MCSEHSPLPWLFVAAVVAMSCLPDEPHFGPPNNLRERGVGSGGSGGQLCALPPGVDESGNTCPDWTTDIFEPIFDDVESAACTADGCHGGINGAKGLTLVAADAAASYAALAAYDNVDGHPYIRPGGADDAYLMCNIWKDAPRKIGSLMPIVQGHIKLIEGQDLVTVGNWVACGMPEGEGATGGGGSGGTGGNGGQGGG